MMTKHLGLGILFSSLVSCAVSNATMTQEMILKNYTLRELDQAALVLRVIADSGDKSALAKQCKLTSSKAMSMTQVAAMLMDQAMEKAAAPSATELSACEADCRCGLYSDILRKLNDSKADAIYTKASKMTNDDAGRCAKAVTWFCASSLKRYLESEAP